MKKQFYLLAIDQSTQGTKAMLLDRRGNFLLRRDIPHRQLISEAGWVGHDAREIADHIFSVAGQVLHDAAIPPEEVAGVAVTNQRESVAAWDRATGEPICESIVWQCNRAADLCRCLSTPEAEKMIYQKTGLKLSPFFSAAKAAWILENIPGAREKALRGELCFGTMDTWTIWQLTGGRVFKTDASNASRTQLFNIHTMQWDPALCVHYGIPMQCLAQVCDSDALFGETDLGGLLPRPVPIHAAIGDTHGVMFANDSTNVGDVMCGFGTGSCVMMNTGTQAWESDRGVNTTVAWSRGGKPTYALEGVVNYSGAVVTWLEKEAKLVANPAESAALAAAAAAADHTYMVPAFTGIGAPWWKSDATAAYVGMTRNTGRAEMVRAALESVAYQIADLVLAFEKETETVPKEFRVAGGPTHNEYLMQFQSDILGCPVVVPEHEELSGIGSAYLAGIAMGLYDPQTLRANQKTTAFLPRMTASVREEKLRGWRHALETVLGY
jgi:glycerol kinase